MKKMKIVVLLSVFIGLLADAMAGVNLRNGNFYISYTDIVVPGAGKSLEVTRTYNSKSTEVGWFGFGWGSDFETRLEISADGSIILHENGAGAKTRFTPKTQIDPDEASKKIVEAMRKKTTITEKAAADLIERLKNNQELRHAYALNFKVASEFAEGTVLYSNQRGMQTLNVLKDGFKRDYSDGKSEFFNAQGKMVKITEKDYVIDLVYSSEGNLQSIKDSFAKQLYFDWYADGRVKSIWSVGDKKVEYKFKERDLIESKDVAGNVYKYEFDQNHNMVTIAYSDDSKMQIKYEPKTMFVSEVVARNGDWTKYKYESDPKNKDLHYWTLVTTKGFDGQPATNRYEYEIKARPDGSRYTYRILTEINGIKTETVYTECCSLPLKIARGNHVTNFEYNTDGLLTKKTSSRGDFVQIEYDKETKKISKVVNAQGWTEFNYDKGNLSKAVNSKGQAVLLVYDTKGKITKMVDNNTDPNQRRVLSFVYNSLGKPVEITMEKVGKIQVSYDNYGEIKKVESAAGHKMALQVTQAFQNLLAIVKPAGVNLNM